MPPTDHKALLVRLVDLGEATTEQLQDDDTTKPQTRRRMRLLSSAGLVRFDRRELVWRPTWVGRTGAHRMGEH